MNTPITQDQDNQHTSDYEAGFTPGVNEAKRTIVLGLPRWQTGDAVLLSKALLAYGRAGRTVRLDREQFVAGFDAGYQAYFDGII